MNPHQSQHDVTLDVAALETLSADLGDPDLLEVIVEAFLDGLPSQVAALVTAHAAGDRAAVASTAHLIKGSAVTFGARRLAALCEGLETGPSRGAELAPLVQEEGAAVCAALRARLGLPD